MFLDIELLSYLLSAVHNVIVGSEIPKNSVPRQRIEPQSLVFQVSIITPRSPRQLSTMTFIPSEESVSSHFDHTNRLMNPIIGY